jgi:Ni/Co efflux regulator RcnB
MKKLIFTLLLAAFSFSTFAMPPQQDTTKKAQKHKMKSKSKSTKSKQGKMKKSKMDSTRRDTTMRPPL